VEAARARPARVPTILFAVLLAAALIIGAVVVRAKSPDLAVEITKLPGRLHDPFTGQRARHAFSPDGDGRHDVAHITLFIRANEPHATVELIDPSSQVVKTLAADVPLSRDQKVHYRWDGRNDEGVPVPAASYRVRVLLPSQDRDAVDPRRIVVFRR
jgi:hypothetical protein